MVVAVGRLLLVRCFGLIFVCLLYDTWKTWQGSGVCTGAGTIIGRDVALG